MVEAVAAAVAAAVVMSAFILPSSSSSFYLHRLRLRRFSDGLMPMVGLIFRRQSSKCRGFERDEVPAEDARGLRRRAFYRGGVGSSAPA